MVSRGSDLVYFQVRTNLLNERNVFPCRYMEDKKHPTTTNDLREHYACCGLG